MKRTVFISHSSADRAIADRLCAYLERNGVGCWIAPRDVTPGKNYGAAIIDAIDECRVFVLILSSQSNKSRQVVREVERAASTDSVILPFRIEDVQPSRDIAFYVSAAHWLDAAKHPVDEQFDELLAAIQDWQKTGRDDDKVASSPPPLPPTAPRAISPPRSFRSLPLLIGGGILIALAVGALAIYLIAARQHEKITEPSSQEAVTRTPTAPTPTATATPPEPTPTAPEPTPAETPSATPPSSPTATPIRLKPGERLRQTTPEASAPSVVPSPVHRQPLPGQPRNAAAPAGPIVVEVAASSQLNNESRPNYAFDGNPSTEWVAKGSASEQTLFAHFKSPALVRSVSILNGDGRDDEHYQASNRIKTLRIVLSDGTNQLFTLNEERKMQRFALTKPVTATWAKFEIVSVYSGKTKRTGIAEITFNEDEQ